MSKHPSIIYCSITYRGFDLASRPFAASSVKPPWAILFSWDNYGGLSSLPATVPAHEVIRLIVTSPIFPQWLSRCEGYPVGLLQVGAEIGSSRLVALDVSITVSLAAVLQCNSAGPSNYCLTACYQRIKSYRERALLSEPRLDVNKLFSRHRLVDLLLEEEYVPSTI
jgi:hypothetical protein